MVKQAKIVEVISAVCRLNNNKGVITSDIKSYLGGGLDIKRALKTALREGLLTLKNHRLFPSLPGNVEEARRRRRGGSRRRRSRRRSYGITQARRRRRSRGRSRRRGRRHAESEPSMEVVELRRRRSKGGRRRRRRGRRHASAGVQYVMVRRRSSRSRSRRRRRRSYARSMAAEQQAAAPNPNQQSVQQNQGQQ